MRMKFYALTAKGNPAYTWRDELRGIKALGETATWLCLPPLGEQGAHTYAHRHQSVGILEEESLELLPKEQLIQRLIALVERFDADVPHQRLPVHDGAVTQKRLDKARELKRG